MLQLKEGAEYPNFESTDEEEEGQDDLEMREPEEGYNE